MKVVVGGMVGLPMSELSPIQIRNIKEQLTIYPKKTTDIGHAPDPDPIFMFEEDFERGIMWIPRGYYLATSSKVHDEDLRISRGLPMREFGTKFRAEGPFKEQGDVLDVFSSKMEGREWGGFLLKAGCGFGKALCHGEPVLTPNGYIPIERISVGDVVAGTDGGFHKVTGVYPQGRRKCYRVTFTDGTHVDCDSDHLWTFEKRRSRNRIVTITTKDLLNSNLRGKSGRVFWLPDQKPVRFSGSGDLRIDPYTLGALLGDGSIVKSIGFTSADDEIVGNLVLPDGCHLVECVGHCGNAKQYRVTSDGNSERRVNPMLEAIRDLGLDGANSKQKWIPHEYRYASVGDRLSLLQGLFDTDGCAVSSGLVEYSTTSKDLAHNVKFIVESLGGTCVMSSRDTWYSSADGDKVGPFSSFRLTVKLPLEMSPFRLDRKASVVRSASWQRRIGRAVDSVVELPGLRHATCISVDSPDHLFLTRGCIATHNTATALEIARRLKRKTIILVHQEFFLDQWAERIGDFMPDARVGVIRQSKCEFEENDFVIAMMQSLARDDGKKYPRAMYDAFGTLITDECHRVAASTWSGLVPRFSAAWRIGLSATPRRKDGAQDVFFHHISPISYSAETEAQIPKLRTVRVHTRLKPISRGRYKVAVEDLNSAQVINQVSEDSFRSKEIVDQLVLAVKAGRKIMVVSERIQHLKVMSDMLTNALFSLQPPLPFIPRVDYYTGEWYTGKLWENTTKGHVKGDPKMESRSREDLKKAEQANVIFATKQMVSEGLDIQALDVMILATPFSDIEQAVGRIRRWCVPSDTKCPRLCSWRAGKCEGKPTPIVVDVIDEEIPQLIGKWRKRRQFYERLGVIGKGTSDGGESERQRSLPAGILRKKT